MSKFDSDTIFSFIRMPRLKFCLILKSDLSRPMHVKQICLNTSYPEYSSIKIVNTLDFFLQEVFAFKWGSFDIKF